MKKIKFIAIVVIALVVISFSVQDHTKDREPVVKTEVSAKTKTFKIIVILRKKEGISKEEFHKHWQEKHGPLFKKFPQIQSYVQFHVTDKGRDNTDLPIDGIAILEFESKEEMSKAWKMLEYDAVRKDELRFLKPDGSGVHVVYVDEEVDII